MVVLFLLSKIGSLKFAPSRKVSFSNPTQDKYLLRQIRCKSEGYISIKLMTSFKKVKKLTRDWQVVRHALKLAPQLELSPEGYRVKRRDILPETLSSGFDMLWLFTLKSRRELNYKVSLFFIWMNMFFVKPYKKTTFIDVSSGYSSSTEFWFGRSNHFAFPIIWGNWLGSSFTARQRSAVWFEKLCHSGPRYRRQPLRRCRFWRVRCRPEGCQRAQRTI